MRCANMSAKHISALIQMSRMHTPAAIVATGQWRRSQISRLDRGMHGAGAKGVCLPWNNGPGMLTSLMRMPTQPASRTQQVRQRRKRPATTANLEFVAPS
jgi:hypothetical protein